MKGTTTLLESQCEALRGLPPDQFKAAVIAIWDYELYGSEDCEDPVARMALGMVKPLIDKRERLSKSGKAGAESRWQTDGNPMANDSKPMAIDSNSMANGWQTDGNPMPKEESRKKKVESRKEIYRRFTPPSVEQVREYVAEKGYKVDPESFVDFYESKGWMVGKNKMKDWKASVRTWARSQRQESTAKGKKPSGKFDNFGSSGTDWDAVTAQIMEAQGL